MIEFALITIFILMIWSIKKFTTIFNPITLFCSGYLFSLISLFICNYFDLLRGQDIILLNTSIAYYLLAIVIFILPWINYKDTNLYSPVGNYNHLHKKTVCVVVINFLLMFVVFYYFKSIPIIQMIRGELDVETFNNSLKYIPAGILAFINACSTILYMFFSSNIYKHKGKISLNIKMIILFLLCLFCTIWQGKRQGLMLFIFILIAMYIIKKRIKINLKTICIIFLFFSLFYFIFTNISYIRNGYQSQYELISYSMYPAMNFSYLSDIYPPLGTTIFPNKIFSEIIPNRYNLNNYDFTDYLFESTSPSGYLSYWFMDYGVYGIIIGALLLSIISKICYSRRFLSEYNSWINILIMWACFTSFVYSHLLTIVLYIQIAFIYIYFKIRINIK